MASVLLRASRQLPKNSGSSWFVANNVSTTSIKFTDDPDDLRKKKDAVPIKHDLALLNPAEVEHRKRLQGYITVSAKTDLSPVTGVPPEHVKERTVRIYEPPKNCMQSGTDNIDCWLIEFDTRERWENPLMGWSSTGDPLSNLKVEFTSKDEAIAHCEKNGWNWFVQEKTSKPMRPKSYGVNFSWNKRTRVSTK
ncbi:NADH dehydrogenase [ubiquinone] iron-sulfur protein 4, mitochondrial-like [Onthophagus taurus]|uniref:NADH dehydrogenase [ubiquinone] iron-sulfur protein 4, mitochondrial-like n=1 Tax=Onthophagus taurus TaxID=166361 RepID=UPI000C1FEBDB|nr:NADH dehydrogenase [ubiquinone] iron-sulfur protein 4, mitochondrial-like [Onthophagus taurus]XP_022921147.1 NADH dehydrogenase [ubiquinone] iron-sulfur protein 4, mitochondrial-like [Onthophagus taurus]